MKHTITRLIALILTLVIFAGGGGRADQVTEEEEWIWPDAPKTQQEETPSAEDETEGAEMAKIETYFDCDLKKAVQVQPLNGNVFSLDNNGNRIGVRIFDNGVKTTVTGTVTGRAILADNSTVNLNGGLTTVNGQSVAYVDVPQGALLIPGTIKITIQLTASGVITTLAAILSTVYQTKTDNVITPSAQVIADWNAEISSAIQTQNATIASAIATQDAQISDLKSALNTTSENFRKQAVIAQWLTSYYLPCKNGSKIRVQSVSGDNFPSGMFIYYAEADGEYSTSKRYQLTGYNTERVIDSLPYDAVYWRIDCPEANFISVRVVNEDSIESSFDTIADSTFKKTTINTSLYLHKGLADSDGSFKDRDDIRYVFKRCVGLIELEYISPCTSNKSLFFYNANMEIIEAKNSANASTTVPTKYIAPAGAVYYAMNCQTTYLSYLSVKETTNTIIELNDAVTLKQDKDFDYSIQNLATISKSGFIDENGKWQDRANTRYIIRNAKGIKKILLTTVISSAEIYLVYGANGTVLAHETASTYGTYTRDVTMPTGAEKYAVCCMTDSTSDWKVTETINVEGTIVDQKNEIAEQQYDYAHLVTPKWIPAVVGFPFYIFFENMISNGLLKDYHVDENYYRDLCYIETPTSAGETSLTFSLFDKSIKVDSKTITVKAVSANTAGTKKILIIGDSKSAAQPPWIKLGELLEADGNMNITFLGTVTSGGYAREAYSGKSIINVCDNEYISGTTPNIFYDGTVTTEHNHHFSFAKAVQTLGDTPDIVFIDHGANQWGKSWNTIKGCYDDIIASIHSVSSSIKIVIVAQEGTGLLTKPTYRTDGKYWMDNTANNEQKMLSEYSEKESSNVYVQPQYLFIDLYRDFPICELPESSMSTGLIEMCMDNIHPGLNADTWSGSTAYKYGAWVNRNGKGYGCKKENTNVDPETDDGTYWAECKNLNDGYMKKAYMYYYMLKYLASLDS